LTARPGPGVPAPTTRAAAPVLPAPDRARPRPDPAADPAAPAPAAAPGLPSARPAAGRELAAPTPVPPLPARIRPRPPAGAEEAGPEPAAGHAPAPGAPGAPAQAVPPPAAAGPTRAPARRGRDIRWGGPAAAGPTPAPPGREPAAGGGARYVPWSTVRGGELAGDYQPRPDAWGQGMATGLGEALSQAGIAARRPGGLPGHEEDVLRQEEEDVLRQEEDVLRQEEEDVLRQEQDVLRQEADALSLEGADESGTDSGSAAARSRGSQPASRGPRSRRIGWNGVLIPGNHHGQH
jgi:hypothetical protein